MTEKKGGKQRRPAEKHSQKKTAVYFTKQEYSFLKAAADTLNQTFSLFMREAAIEKAEKVTDLKLEDFSDGDAEKDE
jgi:uncharacterized protein (DUF1778 family)